MRFVRTMRRSRALVGWALVVAVVGSSATVSEAHAVGVSRGEYRADGATVRAELVFAGPELAAAVGDGGLAEWVGRGLLVTVPAGPCAGSVEGTAPTEGDGTALTVVFRCPGDVGGFSVRLDLLADLSLGHRHLLTATAPSATVHGVLYAAEPELMLAETNPRADRPRGVATAMLRLGVEHILAGYDHLLFLFAVILVGGSLRPLLGVVTAFTLAHSVTLAIAAAGLWTPHPAVVEPAIALSIAYVGLKNCVAPDVRRRWRLTFLFGLVHGFGFAGALREVELPAGELPLALAAFNAGVEAGQLAVLALGLPLVSWLTARSWFRHGGLQAASGAIAATGLWWFVVRLGHAP